MARIHWRDGKKSLRELMEIAAETLVGERGADHGHRRVTVSSSEKPGMVLLEMTGVRTGDGSWSATDACTLTMTPDEFRLMLTQGMREYDR